MLKIPLYPREILRFPRQVLALEQSCESLCDELGGDKYPVFSKNLAIAHRSVRDDLKGWGGKHLVTNGTAWCPVSNTGAAQSRVGSQRWPN